MTKKPDTPSSLQLRILPYAHCDLAALHTRYWHKARYKEIFDRVVEQLEKSPDFRWYFDCYRSQLQALFEQYPEKKELFDRYIAEKRLNFVGAYANIRPNMVGEETYLNNLFIIRDILPDALCEVYGEEVDVALGHAQLPQILAQFGYTLYKIYRPCDVLDAKGVPSAFRWKGFDGSEIRVVRSDYSAFDRQGTDQINTQQEAEQYLLENAQNCIAFSDIPLVWVNCGCDDVPPFITNQANNNGKVFDVDMHKVLSLVESSPRLRARLSSPLEFAHELETYDEQLQTLNGCLDCADVSYNIALNGEKGLVPLRLQADLLLVRAARWQVFAQQLGIDLPYDFDANWRLLLTACCHATQWLFDEDFAEIKDSLNFVVHSAKSYLKTVSDAIAKRIDAGDNALKIFFNDSPYAGYYPVTFKLPCADQNDLQLVDGQGNAIVFEVISSHDYFNTWELEVQAQLYLPAYGYTVVRAAKGDVRALYGKSAQPKPTMAEASLAGEFTAVGAGFRLTFCNGELLRVNDYTALPSNAFNALTYFGYPYCGTWWEHYADRREQAVWQTVQTVRASDNALQLILHGKLADLPITQKITAVNKQLQFEISFAWKNANAWITASVPVDDCKNVLCDIPFGRQRVNVEEEYRPEIFDKCTAHRKRKGVITAKRFIAGECNGKDIALLRGNSDRYFQCDIDQKSLGIILLNSVIRTPGLWETDVNDSVEAVGNHAVCYSVLFDSPTEQALHLALNKPFSSDMVRKTSALANPLPPYGSFFSLQATDVLLTSLQRNKEGVSLRVAETKGVAQNIAFPTQGYAGGRAVKLSGETIAHLKTEGDCFVYPLRPFEIVTFVLKEKT